MKLKIICGQLEITPGRPDVNYKKIIDAIEKARSLEADILLLPEMALPGYLIGDIWEQQTFLDDCAYYAIKFPLPPKYLRYLRQRCHRTRQAQRGRTRAQIQRRLCLPKR